MTYTYTKTKKEGWPWYVKVMLVAFLVAFVGSYAVAQLDARALRSDVERLEAQHTADSTQIIALMNRPADTVVQVVTEHVPVDRWRTRTVTDTVVETIIERAPPCPICQVVTDTVFVNIVQTDTVVHTVEVVSVVAKRNWWEFAILSGISFGAGYLIGDSDEPEQICVEESPGFCQ